MTNAWEHCSCRVDFDSLLERGFSEIFYIFYLNMALNIKKNSQVIPDWFNHCIYFLPDGILSEI